jgi:hypothetical protein
MNILFELFRPFDGDLLDKAVVKKLSSTREAGTSKLLQVPRYFS